MEYLTANMEDLAEFEVTLEELTLQVTEHYIGEQRIFRIIFPDKRKPLVITVAQSLGKKFWTSVPQGRQEEAEKVGRLIALYFKNR